jgi:ABC-2 type transport system permease protein
MSPTAPAAASPRVVEEISSPPGALRRLIDVWRYRELLVNLTRKELKVKYKKSALGFMWSLANPALYLVVFYIVFQVIMKSGIPDYPVYLLAGLLPFSLWQSGLVSSTVSVTGNSALVNKVYFPRDILPLASIGAALVHYVLQTSVLLLALVVFQHAPSLEYALVLVPALLALVVVTAAFGIAFSALNAYLRDTQHLLELALLAWFWMTPVVYAYRLVADRLGHWSWLYFLNPLTAIVITYQRVIYNRTTAANGTIHILPDGSVWWYLRNVAIVLAVAILLLIGALRLFSRLEGNIAEEL